MIQNKADDEKCASQDAGSAYEKLVIYVFNLIFFINNLESLYLINAVTAMRCKNIISQSFICKARYNKHVQLMFF